MLFNSWPFVVFLFVVVSVFWGLPYRYRLFWLLISSYFFYSWWDPAYLFLLLGSTLINYGFGHWLSRVGTTRTAILTAGVAVNLGVLFYFKYFSFTVILLGFVPAKLPLLPLGISFITLQAISYLVDIYRRELAPVGLYSFALYKSFFPQLLAGPIERAGYLIPQFSFRSSPSWTSINRGIKLMLWGYFKKVLIADKLALLIDPVFQQPWQFTPLILCAVIILFSTQIYCDFSGYTDIARGGAELLGIKLSINFQQPYLAASPQAFWQRWHRTLHLWFKQYLYQPLVGKQANGARQMGAVVFVFLLSGLWHGASLTFLVWGLYHCGIYLAWLLLSKTSIRLPRPLDSILTFVTITIGWVWFRSPSLHHAHYMLGRLMDSSEVGFATSIKQSLEQINRYTSLGLSALGVLSLLVSLYILIEYSGLLNHFLRTEEQSPWPLSRLVLLDLMLVLLVLFGDWAGTSFLYFQF